MGLYDLFMDLQKLDQNFVQKNEKEKMVPCDVCGQPFSYADRISLANGICCPRCKDKLSPWFDRELSCCSVLDIQNHTTYRDKNFTELFDFNPTIKIGDELQVLIDERMKKFIIARRSSDYKEVNSDLISFNSILSCNPRIVQSRDEIFFRDSLGRTGRFTPRAFAYKYDFMVNIETNIPFMSRIDFKVNESMVGSNQPTTIQVSEEKFTNKIKDFFKMNRMYPGKIDNSEEVKNSKAYRNYNNIMVKICKAIQEGKENYNNSYYDKTKYMICQWCGSKIDINSSTCPHCGGFNK